MAPSLAQSAPAPQQGQGQTTGASAAPDQTAEMKQENAEKDITYLKSRLVYRYDYKSQEGDVFVNRFRVKALYGFGPNDRLAFTVLLPVSHVSTPTDSATGIGNMEFQFGGYIYKGESFSTGALVELDGATASDPLLGGSSTDFKVAYGITQVFRPRYVLNAVFNYKHSIYINRGLGTHEFEPDITLSTRRLGASWFVEYDSYYLFIPEEYAQTFKVGLSKALGKEHHWVATPYWSFPLNSAGRQTQYQHNVGVDVVWYPEFMNRH